MEIKVKLEGFDRLRAILSPDVYKKAAVRSVNRAAQAAFNAGSKEIRKTYALKAKDIKDDTTLKKASWSKTEAVIRIISKDRISLSKFGARQTKKGVSFKIKKNKGRGLIRGAFIVNRFNNQVFKRKSKKRLPIIALKADISAAELFDYKPVRQVVDKTAVITMQKEFRRNWEFYSKKVKR